MDGAAEGTAAALALLWRPAYSGTPAAGGVISESDDPQV
jgi:hypothetical protein